LSFEFDRNLNLKGENVRNDYRKLFIGTISVAVNEIDPHGSRPYIASSPSNGLESIQENYTAKNPDDPLYGKIEICMNRNTVNI